MRKTNASPLCMRFLQLTSAVVLSSVIAAPVLATEWMMVNGYADDNYMTKNLRALTEDVAQLSNGQFQVTLHSNGTLIPLDGIRRAVQSGQVQMGEIRLGTFGNEDPMYILDGIPFLANGYERAWTLMQLQRAYFDKLADRQGMKVIAYQPWPAQGFYSREPIDSVDDFKGKTMRIYSRYTQQMGDMLGSRTVTLPFAEIPQAFATGMIDTLFTSPQIGIDIQAWDNTKHYVVVGALNTKNAIVVNKKAFQRLSEEEQKVLLEAGERASKRGWELSEQSFNEQLEVLKSNGMQVVNADPVIIEKLEEIGKTLTEQWRKEASPEAVLVLDQYLQQTP